MALIKNRVSLTTAADIESKPRICHTCKERKTGIFRMDAYGKAQCFDCMPPKDQAVYAQPS